MTKSNITEYDNTAANNTDVEDVPLGENLMYPSDVNNAFREIMADLADVNDGTVALTSPSATALDVTNNITVGGTVDGRDVATDGTKLDGIEASATADQTASEIKTAYESNADTNEFSDAEQTKLAGIEAAADVTDTANVTAAGAAMLTGATFTGNITGVGATFTDIVKYSFTNGTLLIRNGNTVDGNKITSKNAAENANGYLAFEGHDKEYGRFDSSGQFGIGTNSPSSPLEVRYNGGLAWGVRVVNIGGGSAQQTAIRFLRSTTTSVGFISTTNTATQYVTSSDYRLKENAVDISDGITRLKQLQPKRFNFIDDDSVVDGFMAHEAQAVVPEAVTGTKDALDSDGNPDYQGIDQSKLVPLLTAALKEAIAKIETLETKVAALEAN